MAEFASSGVGAAGLTTGIIGTSLGALNSGLLKNVFGVGTGGGESDHCVSRYELGLEQQIAAKDSKIALLESNIYVDSKIADVYERLNTKIGALEKQCCEQAVFNATCTATMNCISGQVNSLLALTKVVVPNSSICPGWGNVTVAPATTAATTSLGI